jgi:hypothetical protein
MKQLHELQAQVKQQKAELAQYSDNDPERYEAMSESVVGNHEDACNWLSPFAGYVLGGFGVAAGWRRWGMQTGFCCF